MTADEEADLAQAEEVCRRFLGVDLAVDSVRKDGSGLEDGGVRDKLKEVLAQDEADDGTDANKENEEDRMQDVGED